MKESSEPSSTEETPNYEEMGEQFYREFEAKWPEEISIDCETTGVAYHDLPFAFTVAWENESHYIEWECKSARQAFLEAIPWSHTWIFHNAKFDLEKMLLIGAIDRDMLDEHQIEDTETQAHLLDEHRLKGLKVLARDLLGETTDEDEALRVVRRKLKLKKADGYHQLPREVIIPYAKKDASFTFYIHQLLRPQVAQFPDLNQLYLDEIELMKVVLDMERAGIGVDLEYVNSTLKEYNGKALGVLIEIQDLVGNQEFKPNSPKQLLEAFSARGIELESTDKKHLKEVDDPLAEKVLEYRGLGKMANNWLKSLLENTRDGVIHPWFRMNKTKTGRFASGGVED